MKIALLLTFLVLINNSKAQSVESLVKRLTDGQFVKDTSLELEFKRIGKSAIPYLINAIDKNRKGFVGFQSLSSSDLSLTANNYVGIRAAYMIECILSDSTNTQIYDKGVIVRKSKDKIIHKPLEYDDVIKIKRIYSEWWDKNKAKSIEQLKTDLKENKGILDNPYYVWM